MGIKLIKYLKVYSKNSTLTAIHYILEDGTHWTERLFWLAMIIMSWYGAVILIITAWNSFLMNPISFVVETNYIEWETRFPSIAFCETENLQRVYEVSDKLWSQNHSLDLEEVLKELAFFDGKTLYTLNYCGSPNSDPLCPKNSFSNYAQMVRTTCHNAVSSCSYNNIEFDCCKYFLPIDTDIGKCYIINSIQTSSQEQLPMVSSIEHNLAVFKMTLHIPAQVFTLGKEDIPSLNTDKSTVLTILDGGDYRRLLTVRDIENDPDVVATSIEQRACRYNWEVDSNIPYRYYSYSACIIQCRRMGQLEACNCTDHFMPGSSEEERCDLNGLACLNVYQREITGIKPIWSRRPGLVCNCLQSCTEAEIYVIYDEEKLTNLKGSSKVEVVLHKLPSERYKRNVIRSRLDLVVTIGGTIGLFVGASLLSFAEIVIYIFIRICVNNR